MSVQIIVDCDVKADSLSEMNAFMKDNLADTRAFDGCESLTVQTNVDDPQNMVIVEQWQSREHYENYLGWRTETGDMEKAEASKAR